MAKKLRYLFLLLGAAAAASIVPAPVAAADPPSCFAVGGYDTQCQSPGNVQINDAPPAVQYTPQYPYWGGDSIIVPGMGRHGFPGHR